MAKIFTPIPRDETSIPGGNEYFLIALKADVPCTVDASNYATFSADASQYFVKVEPRQETLKTTQVAATSEQGTHGFDQTITCNIEGRSLVLTNEIALYSGNEVKIVVVDNIGLARVWGDKNGLKLDPGTTEDSGAKISGEGNNNIVIFKGMQKSTHPFLTALKLAKIMP